MSANSLSRLAILWATVRDSLWFVPTLAVAAAVVLAVAAIQIPTPSRIEDSMIWRWLFGGGAEGARGVLATIAGSLITVTGVVFSVTIVALQLASSQFTPRVLRGFVSDRLNQAVLGVFIGTFTYTLLVLRSIRSSSEDGRVAFVPQVAVSLAVLLLLVSIGALIAFIDHSAQSIQASTILHRETRRARALVDTLFPEHVGEPDEASADGRESIRLPAEPPAVIAADSSGYVQGIDADALWSGAEGRPLLIRMDIPIGAFVFPGKPLASVWPAHLTDDAVIQAVRDSFILGSERTPEQDVEYGLVALADIAVRALSPGINDPTTALHCIDHLTEILAALGSRRRPDPLRTSPDKVTRLLVCDSSFDRATAVAFDQIRHYGASDPTVARALLDAISDLAGVVRPEARPALTAHADAVVRAARRAIEDPGDLARVERAAERALTATRG